jgi:predicted dinucleotide-binding enzyme
MFIGILGTGQVAQTLARALSDAGHQISLGSRDPQSKTFEFPVLPLAEAVATADVVINATLGSGSLETLTSIGADAFAGKIVLDVANANTPAFDLLYPNSSLGEQLQAALPGAKIVKTMNTASMAVITDPSALGPSSVFVSGEDAGAKAIATSILTDLGWPADSVVDLGDIRSARGVEHYFLLFAALMQAKRSPMFNIQVTQ